MHNIYEAYCRSIPGRRKDQNAHIAIEFSGARKARTPSVRANKKNSTEYAKIR